LSDERQDMEPELKRRPDTTAEGQALYDAALKLAKDKKPELALEQFLELVHWDRGRLSKKVRRAAHEKAASCVAQLRDWPLLDEVSRLAMHRYPEFGWPYRYLGEASWRMGKRRKAIGHLERAIELDPELADARAILQVALEGKTPVRARVAGWPARQRAFKGAREAIQQYVLRGQPGERFIGPDTVFMTFGSCFAENLAARLREAGHRVNAEPIGEDVNSTYANRHLLEWIEAGPINAQTRMMHQVYGEAMRERLRRQIEDTDVFVLTLGLAPCFFDRRTGAFAFSPIKSETAREFLHANYEMRTTSVSENIRNLNMILESLRRMTSRPPRIVLTVSPVPMSGTTEFDSAVIADCVSKSTLRVACHEVASVQAASDVIYWPSFEIVRWLGPHFGPEHPAVYGQDDANTRHVSGWIVRLIVDLFLERYGDAPKAAEIASAALSAAGPC
jgi:tetratricopeptide (TPR) repeat protein